ncbi:MAG: LytTR family transcriptional regulator [Lachnospiraceae bacterium]|nr:LytTR family transcriptional regulator [Lachnospiraceae bacterium]
MQIKAVIDKVYTETEIHVCNNEMNEHVTGLIRDIDELLNVHITGTDRRGEKCVLKLKDIVCFYASGQKVLTRDDKGNEYSVQHKLYELEEKLPDTLFLRIAKSEIVNIKKIKRLDMSVTGTIKVIMTDQSETYTSRRNVTRLKQTLGI